MTASTITRAIAYEAFAALPTAVVALTAEESDGRPTGMTVSSVCTLSLTPAKLVVCVQTRSRTLATIRRGGAFAVNVLGAGHEWLAQRFAGPYDADKFRDVTVRRIRGVPVLEACPAWFRCEIDVVHPAGDHLIVVGLVTESAATADPPLVRVHHEYGALTPLGGAMPHARQPDAVVSAAGRKE